MERNQDDDVEYAREFFDHINFVYAKVSWEARTPFPFVKTETFVNNKISCLSISFSTKETPDLYRFSSEMSSRVFANLP